ncbi:MAG TPA: hypothetical protein PKM25_10985 [Candidatus Ozemobacteraceae bacterium]|nr:hypothetical protein [Candidatus Ozemobacteraceae bacterium]
MQFGPGAGAGSEYIILSIIVCILFIVVAIPIISAIWGTAILAKARKAPLTGAQLITLSILGFLILTILPFTIPMFFRVKLNPLAEPFYGLLNTSELVVIGSLAGRLACFIAFFMGLSRLSQKPEK